MINFTYQTIFLFFFLLNVSRVNRICYTLKVESFIFARARNIVKRVDGHFLEKCLFCHCHHWVENRTIGIR